MKLVCQSCKQKSKVKNRHIFKELFFECQQCGALNDITDIYFTQEYKRIRRIYFVLSIIPAAFISTKFFESSFTAPMIKAVVPGAIAIITILITDWINSKIFEAVYNLVNDK